jgi:hypothetical protein
MSRTDWILFGFNAVCYAIATAVVLLACWQIDQVESPPARPSGRVGGGHWTLASAGRFLWRVALTGLVLFLLPPFAADPPHWQIGMALFAWIALSYRWGVWGRGRWLWAAAEAAPAVALSWICTHLLVLAGDLAAAV